MAAMIGRLIRRDHGICHYCGCHTTKYDQDYYPTRDHIVPRSLGGINHMDNYVLACYKCNQKRGTSLFYCQCRDCQEKIYDALYEKETLNNIFVGLIRHNKPVIRIKHGKYRVRIGHGLRDFDTLTEAIEFAHHGAFAKDRNYD